MKDWREWEIKNLKEGDYPVGLKEVKPRIKQLQYRGEWRESLFEKVVAVVGSRKMTRYGEQATRELVSGLVRAGYTIVSGFMSGVDTMAHQVCLENGGKTVAVLGSGLDQVTPASNDKLYSEVLSKDGVVVSEYEKDYKARLWTFPQRNRIVAGMSQGILVIEGGEKSGSLITAKLGFEQKKIVMAVPGMMGASQSKGTNWLIQNGAKMVTNVSDVLGELDPHSWGKDCEEDKGLFGIRQTEMGMSKDEKRVMEELGRENLEVDELARKLKIGVVELGVLLSEMSLKELVEEVGGVYSVKQVR